jgi:Uncharacterised nucleotidyltransferase
MNRSPYEQSHLSLLSSLLFESGEDLEPGRTAATGDYSQDDFEQLWELATIHHVILRTFPPLLRLLPPGSRLGHWVTVATAKESQRIANALEFLGPICEALGAVGDVIVIKSLDHWPDLGNDLDLYTNASGKDVAAVMRDRFNARLAERSWGDRLANKWNFIVPGLAELVEVHVGRLGQTGEQVALTGSLIDRAQDASFGTYKFRVPAPEDRIMISTLQRMYRHFYIRLCDVADNARLVESGDLDYSYLERLARSTGLWDGVATYLTMVSNYVSNFRGKELPLPASITEGARFDTANLEFRRKFLRVPLFPHGASFFATEWKKLFLSGELRNALRLSLLPSLAVAAAVELKLTGNDKGIW